MAGLEFMVRVGAGKLRFWLKVRVEVEVELEFVTGIVDAILKVEIGYTAVCFLYCWKN